MSILPLLLAHTVSMTPHTQLPILAADARQATSSAGELSLEILTEAAQGPVVIALFDSAASFKAFDGRKDPKKWSRVRALKRVQPSQGCARAKISGLPAGDYGVLVFHDVNGNGKIDTNWVGLPAEPWGLSNNVRPQKFPPKKPGWDDIRFRVGDAATVLKIRVRPGV